LKGEGFDRYASPIQVIAADGQVMDPIRVRNDQSPTCQNQAFPDEIDRGRWVHLCLLVGGRTDQKIGQVQWIAPNTAYATDPIVWRP
jgi:hypothetical protein